MNRNFLLFSRRSFLMGIWSVLLGGLLRPKKVLADSNKSKFSFSLTKSEWKDRLTADAYYVLREEGTERPFSSSLNNEKRQGVFACAGCDFPLFDSSAKFDSGTGWPSFWEGLPNAIETKTDFKLIVPRTEYRCSNCGGHQGHVFNDGPPPTGKRFCNNGVALVFQTSN